MDFLAGWRRRPVAKRGAGVAGRPKRLGVGAGRPKRFGVVACRPNRPAEDAERWVVRVGIVPLLVIG
jgi:hypothetical protein